MIIKTSPDEIENYLSDAANVKGFCDAVYFPENENGVKEALKSALAKNAPVTVSGNGTGLTGARVPKGGVVISTEKMNKILEINKEEKYALIQPAVILKDFQEMVESQGLFYPPDPTERNCFIGATAATNSSGARTFKYGPTRNYVLELRVVLSNGETLHLTRGKEKAEGLKLDLKTEEGSLIKLDIPDYSMPQTKHAAGYFCKPGMDAIDLFIGSEGTLGVITELKLKLLDLPENIMSAVIFFDKEDDALGFIARARNLSYETRADSDINGLDAQGLEYFDFHSLKFMRDEYPQIPGSARAAVWFEQEITSENEETLFEKWMELIAEFNGNEETAWFASNKSDLKRFKDFRHAISWKVSEYIARKGITKVGTDIAVPDEVFNNFYHEIKNKVEEAGLNYIIYGHFGNSHAHLNMLPEDQDQFKEAKKLYMEICRRAVELKGTVSAEHGIGKLKKEYLMMMYGEENIKQMARLKTSLDPNKILGLGNIFDEKYLN
ncbi:MAG: FAD-binding oxidoreductase [Syntrophomonadaceae bacterium]